MQTADPMLELELPRFGRCSYRDSEVLLFPWGIPGFVSLRRFLALSVDGHEKYVWLQSLDDLEVAFPTADPWQIFGDYAPQLPTYARESLEIERPDEFATLCLVVASAEAAELTMNLLAPVVINLRTRVGRQVTLESGGYSVRTPVPRTARPLAAGA